MRAGRSIYTICSADMRRGVLTLAVGARVSFPLWRSASSASSSAAGCAPAFSALLMMLWAFPSCPAFARLAGFALAQKVRDYAIHMPPLPCAAK